MGLCVSTDNRGYEEAEDARAPEEEAGWTAEESPKGLKVLETEHSSRNVLAQYLHNIFKLHSF